MKGPAEGGGAALVACRGWVLCIGCSLVVARCMGVGTGLELGSLHGPPSPPPPPIAIDVCFGGGGRRASRRGVTEAKPCEQTSARGMKREESGIPPQRRSSFPPSSRTSSLAPTFRCLSEGPSTWLCSAPVNARCYAWMRASSSPQLLVGSGKARAACSTAGPAARGFSTARALSKTITRFS